MQEVLRRSGAAQEPRNGGALFSGEKALGRDVGERHHALRQQQGREREVAESTCKLARLAGGLGAFGKARHQDAGAAVGKSVQGQLTGEWAQGAGRGEMQQCLTHLAAPQTLSQRSKIFDAGLGCIKKSIEEVEQGLAAEIGDACLVGPDNARTLAVPQPGWLRKVPQILQRWQTRLAHLPCRGLAPRPLVRTPPPQNRGFGNLFIIRC